MNNLCQNVSGIRNTQIKTALKNALGKIEGVHSVDIDKTLGRVEIAYNEPANPNILQACITETGCKLS